MVQKAEKVDFRPADGLWVSDGKYKGIAFEAAFRLLLQADDSFFGHKEIIFLGLCERIKRNQSAARRVIARETARCLAEAETDLRREWQDSSALKGPNTGLRALALAGFQIHSNEKYRSLHTKIYVHIGGMTAIHNSFKPLPRYRKTKGKKKRSIAYASTAIRPLVKLAGILDLHARTIGQPSMDKLIKFVGGKSKSRVNEYLKDHRRTFALLYAADRVPISGRGSLLDELLKKNPSREVIVPRIPKWLSYTRYFHETVLSAMKGDWTTTYCPKMANTVSELPELPAFDEQHIRDIVVASDAKRPSEARLQLK